MKGMPQDQKSPMSKKTKFRETMLVSAKLLGFVWEVDRLLFVGNLVAMIVPPAISFINAYLFKLTIDLVVKSVSGGNFDVGRLYYLLALIAVASFAREISYVFQDYVVKALYLKMPLTLYQKVLTKIASLDLQYFEDDKFRDRLQKVRENYDHRPLGMLQNLFLLIQSVVQMLIALAAILKLSPFLAILLLVVSVPDFVNRIYFSKFTWWIWSERAPYRKKYIYITELIQKNESVKELKIFQLGKRFLHELSSIQEEFYHTNIKVARQQMGVNSIFGFLDSVVMTGVLGYVVLQAFVKKITVGDITFYFQVVNNFNQGLGGLFRTASRVFEDSLYVKEVFDLLDVEPKIVPAENPVKIDYNKAPKVEFKNVTFAYPGTTRKVFQDFSLVINPGEKIALVGENGAGKTTLIKLLSRFYDVDGGEILVDGINIKNLDLDTWYKTIGILFQDFVRYEYSAKDNIYFGKAWEKEDLEGIVDAARSAGAHEMIHKFDAEYEQMLGRTFEGGMELSGGQWQKVALSRAFFRNAPILVLDEPTAAIDAKAESEIFNRVEKLSKDKTVIIISHRFSTVRNADKIYVVENGKITESGDHKELMKLNGQYANLFNLQAKGYQ